MNQNVFFYLKNKSEVTYLNADMTVNDALPIMKESGYTAVPVINNDGSYAGTITDGDFLWHITENGSMDAKIKSLIRKEYSIPANINTEIEEIFSCSLDQNFVPIVDDRYIFIGIVTRKMILHYLIQESRV